MAEQNKQPTDAQIKEFWERCGFRYEATTKQVCGVVTKCFMWRYPDGSWHEYLPPIDLNNLFKYAVPKVYNLKLVKLNRFEQQWQTAYRADVRLARKEWKYYGEHKDPALALFWALHQVMEVSK